MVRTTTRKAVSVLLAAFMTVSLAGAASALENNPGDEGFATITTLDLGAASVAAGVALTASGGVTWAAGIDHSNALLVGAPLDLTLHSGSDCAGAGSFIAQELLNSSAEYSHTFNAPTAAGSYSVKATFPELLNNGGVAWAMTSSDCANFTVTSGGAGPDETTCAFAAAPAWANHMLRASGLKLKVAQITNYVAMTADEMGPGADFGGVEKENYENKEAYAQAVYDYLRSLGLNVTDYSPWATWTGGPGDQCVTV